MTQPELIAALRAAGCVYAEAEAFILRDSAGSAQELVDMLKLRVQGKPLEHIVGWASFCGERIAVGPGVFVPRRRSEYLVKRALASLAPCVDRGCQPMILDLCCGSGAIGVAIGTGLGARDSTAGRRGFVLHAADLDQGAVDCAKRNLAPLGGHVYCGDLFDPLPARLRGSFDLIVANAPYVPSEAIAFMPSEARIHEPPAALNGGPDGLELHRRIAAQAPGWLRAGGMLLLESSMGQAPHTAAIMGVHGFTTGIFRSAALDGTVVAGHWGP